MGCDSKGNAFQVCSSCFNPRTHMGCDSKHAYCIRGKWKFQSTHPHGVRRAMRMQFANQMQFQSTHPHGVRLTTKSPAPKSQCFNPRTHMGCDTMARTERRVRMVSIHAPTWGATKFLCLFSLIVCVSIHAPTWGATVMSNDLITLRYVSIHAPTWGATSFR